MRKKLIVAAAMFSITCAVNAQTINVTSWVPVTHPLATQVMKPLCSDFARVTEGRVKCNFLPKSVSAPAQTFDAVRDGIADMSFIVDGYTPGRFLLSTVAEFPLAGDSAEVNSVAYQAIFDSRLSKAEEHKGVKVLSVFTHGPGQIYTAKKQVTNIADLSGMKLRTGGGVVNEVISLLGATPMLKPAPEVYELLSGGIIDGFVFNKDSPVSFKLYPLVKYGFYTPGGLYNVAFTIIMNQKKWDSISSKDKLAIQPLLGEPLARRAGKVYDMADRNADETMRKSGIVVTAASPEFIATVKSRTATLEETWAEAAKKRGVDGAQALQEFRAKIVQLTAK